MKVSKKGNSQAVCDFVRAHLHAKLIQAGWNADAAKCVTDAITDDEIVKELSKSVKLSGFSSFLDWLKNNKDAILNTIETIVSLISLFGESGSPNQAKGGEQEDKEPQEESEDQDEDDTDEEESEDEDEESGK